jgi:hypothetical protein
LSVSERLLQIKALRELGPALGPTSRSDLKERPMAPRFAPGDEEARAAGDYHFSAASGERESAAIGGLSTNVCFIP